MNNDKLNPKYREKSTDPMKRETSRVVDVTLNLTDIQNGHDLYVKLATTPSNQIIVPSSRMLCFTFKPGNTKSYHQNNLQANIFKQITHKFNGDI